jgi:hypothetical protein
VTQEISVIERETLILIDSKGFEKESEGDDAMRKLTEFLASRTFGTKIHMVWYVIASDSTRVQDGTREICEKYFKNIPTYFLLTKCDRISPRNLQIMKQAVLDLQLKSFIAVYGLSIRPPSVLDYPRTCPQCPDCHIEPIFNKESIPQTISCDNCKSIYSACLYCEEPKLLLDTTEQNWFCKHCKNEWPQLTTTDSELDILVQSTYDKFIEINEEYAVKFKKGLLIKHLKVIAATTATAVGAGVGAAVVGAAFGGILGAAIGAVGGTIAGVTVGWKTSDSFMNPYEKPNDNVCDTKQVEDK